MGGMQQSEGAAIMAASPCNNVLRRSSAAQPVACMSGRTPQRSTSQRSVAQCGTPCLVLLAQVDKGVGCLGVPDVGQPRLHAQVQVVADLEG